MTRRIAVTGGNGQLGLTIGILCRAEAQPLNLEIEVLDRAQLDITDPEAISSSLGALQPELIINAAAYTQVDRAETDEAAAFAVNADGAANLARWALANEARMIQLSTDFVFDGAADRPYPEDAKTAPLGAYGRSKLAGEKLVRDILPFDSAVVRTSWLYSPYSSNFVKTMLRLMIERDQLKVVNDQVGSPTSTYSLAELLLTMAKSQFQSGVFHWTDGGAISWYDFARQIQQEALQQKLINKQIPILPISTSEYPTPARRPAYSVLDRRRTKSRFACSSLTWQQQLGKVISELKRQSG